MEAPVRRCEMIDRLNYRKSRGRSNKSWSEVIRHDLKTLGLEGDMAQDRRLWSLELGLWILDRSLSFLWI